MEKRWVYKEIPDPQLVEQLSRVRNMDLADSFRMELTVATHCANNKDFHEGVRALLIDKDQQPRWLFDTVNDVPASLLEQMITPPWPENPLKNL